MGRNPTEGSTMTAERQCLWVLAWKWVEPTGSLNKLLPRLLPVCFSPSGYDDQANFVCACA